MTRSGDDGRCAEGAVRRGARHGWDGFCIGLRRATSALCPSCPLVDGRCGWSSGAAPLLVQLRPSRLLSRRPVVGSAVYHRRCGCEGGHRRALCRSLPASADGSSVWRVCVCVCRWVLCSSRHGMRCRRDALGAGRSRSESRASVVGIGGGGFCGRRPPSHLYGRRTLMATRLTPMRLCAVASLASCAAVTGAGDGGHGARSAGRAAGGVAARGARQDQRSRSCLDIANNSKGTSVGALARERAKLRPSIGS